MSSNIEPPKSIDLTSKTLSFQNADKSINKNENNERNNPQIIIAKNEIENFIQNQITIPIHLAQEKNLNNENKENGLKIEEKQSDIIMDENNNIKEENKLNDLENDLKKKLIELKNSSNDELRNNCKEYYLISREWMKKFNNYLKGEENVKLEDLKGVKDNDNFLIEKEIKNRALSLNNEKENMVILKPKCAFCISYKPCPVNKPFWEEIHTVFGLEPEVKEYSEEEEYNGIIKYKRDYCKYVKVNCIILPKKRDYLNDNNFYNNIFEADSKWPAQYNLEKIKKDIETFYFFSRKDVLINDLIDTIENIIRKYPDIKLVENKDYNCWIDFNYFDFEITRNLIKEKIAEIYNINFINKICPLELQKLEEEDSKDEIPNSNRFIFKLYPLKMLENEELQDIFPNQFTDKFDVLNSFMLTDKNNKIKEKERPEELINKQICFTKFPELTIIIEQEKNTLFFKDETKLKYKIGSCDYFACKRRCILTITCECLKKYYCSLKCKVDDSDYHDGECRYSLSNYFISRTNEIICAFKKENIGLKGIRNIGNTCYMSTALQCMSNCAELRNYFLFGYPRKDINKENVLGYKGLVAYGFEFLIRKLWEDNEPVIDLGKFKKAMGLCNERFGGRSQQDTHEFVTFLIDSLHEDLNRVKNKVYIPKEERDLSDNIKSKIEWNNFLRRNQSILIDLFYGLFKSTVICSVCNNSCVDFNTFSSISVNLKNNTKKQNELEANKENEINSKEQKNEENIMDIEKNNESEKETTIQKEQATSVENITNTEIIPKNEKMEIIGSPNQKSEVLVGGKPNESDSFSEKKNENEICMKIPLIFFFYSLDERPIQFGLPIRDKKELTHKVLLYKISKILNKNPYSLCLYHITIDKNIIKIYGKDNFSLYDSNNLENKILFISEISPNVIKNNLTRDSNIIFYDAKFRDYYNQKKNTSREILEYNLIKNKDNIKKCVNNIINEKDVEKDLEDKYLSNYYMNLDKVFQITLKNYIVEEEEGKPHKYIRFPKIIFFSKNINIIDLYFEIFKINKRVMLEEPIDKIKESFEQLFQNVLNGDNINKGPFFLCLKTFDNKKNKHEKQKILFLNEREKNKGLDDIIKEMIVPENADDIQFILEIYWSKKYNENLDNCLKPEKIDSLIDQEKENKERKQILNESMDSTTRSSRCSNNDDIQKMQRERYNNLYDKFSNLNCAPPNCSNDISENKKNENYISVPNAQPLKPCPNTPPPQMSNIKYEVSLEETFESFGEEELLDENNEWYCENCKKKQRAKKKLEIYHTPKILIIQIKRFSHVNKINTKVNFPLKDLDLGKFILSNNNSNSIKYDLFAVANHYGSLSFGHYTAFCKNSVNGKWYEFNDSCVNEITDLSKIVSPSAYVLFYKQKGLADLNWKEIYNKTFVEINIDNPFSLVDYNNDFNNHMNVQCNQENENDINEYDRKIRDIIKLLSERQNKNNENNQNDDNKMEIENHIENKTNDENIFLNKKRAAPECM